VFGHLLYKSARARVRARGSLAVAPKAEVAIPAGAPSIIVRQSETIGN